MSSFWQKLTLFFSLDRPILSKPLKMSFDLAQFFWWQNLMHMSKWFILKFIWKYTAAELL